jgi:hypothetical protein
MRKKFSAAIAAAMAVAGLSLASNAMGAVITGGNPVVAAPYFDTFQNFSILDGNNPINATGDLTSWSIYAPANAGPVELLIYRAAAAGYDLIGHSSLQTPQSAGGFQTFSIPGGLKVQGGDLIGLYFQSWGSVEFSGYDGGIQNGNVLFTNNNVGLNNATDFIGMTDRIYSVNVSGATPEPATWTMLILGMAMTGFAARRRNKRVAVAA